MSFTPSTNICLVWSEKEAWSCFVLHARSLYTIIPITGLWSSCYTHIYFWNLLSILCAVNWILDLIIWGPKEASSNMVEELSRMFSFIPAGTCSTQCNIYWFHPNSGPCLEFFVNFPALRSCLFLPISFFLLHQSHVVRWWLFYDFFLFLRV